MNNPFSIIKMLALSVVISLASCTKDDSPSEPEGNDDLAAQQNAQEERIIPVSELESGISINGATKITGALPTPTSDLGFTLETKDQEAYQEYGFDITFTADENIKGAYIMFKDKDGNTSSSYFDVPADEFYNRRKETGKSKKSRFNQNTKNLLNDKDLGISVNFTDIVKAGTFCYDILAYTASGSISVVGSHCIEVEAWAGNAELVGEWKLDHMNPSFNGSDNIYCDSGQVIQAMISRNLKEEWTINFDEEGNYVEDWDEIYESLSYTASADQCQAIYSGETEDVYRFKGKWAYNEEHNHLFMIDFEYEDLLDPSLNETYDGESAFDGPVMPEIINDQLVLTHDRYDGIQFKIYFNRN